jgi:hypothetical protein
LQQWAVTTAARRGHNKAAVALANKMARIIWAVWHREVDFHAQAAMRIHDHGVTGRTGTEPGR